MLSSLASRINWQKYRQWHTFLVATPAMGSARHEDGNMDELKITVSDDGAYLRTAVTGRSSRGNLLTALQRIVGEARSREMWRVLVDATGIPPPMSTFEKYDLALEFSRIADPQLKTAIVARVEMVDHFFETVARNRGVGVMVFTQEAPALEWLLDPASR
jgi:hypothetical protein